MSSSQFDSLTRAISRLAIELPTSVMDGICARLELLPAHAGLSDLDRLAALLPSNTAKAKYRTVVDAYAASRTPQTPGALAMALRAASATDDWYREFQSLELVWSGPSPYNSRLRRTDQVLLEIISEARHELWIVSFAAYHIKVIDDALLNASNRGAAISLVLESSKESGGRLTLDGLETMNRSLLARSKVYVWPLEKRKAGPDGYRGVLHAKCALSDSEQMLISSANLTEAALGLNIELGILIKGGNQPREAMRQLRWLVENNVLDRYVVP